MSALIGALRVSLSADTASFEQGMRRAQGTASSAASGIQKTLGQLKAGVAGLVGGLTVGMFMSTIKGALEYAGSLAEVAQQLGVTARDLQTFRYAAGQVGVSQEGLETGLSKLTITLGKVAAGAEAPTKALRAIGVSVDDIKGKDTGEAFRIIADGLQKVSDRSQRAAIEVALFGKSGAQLDNLLSGGSSALNELTDAAQKLGIVLSDEQIRKADETADKLAALKTVLSANIASATADNADAILFLVSSLAKLVGIIPKAIQGWSLFLSLGGTAFGAMRTGRNPVAAVKSFYANRNNAQLSARFAGDRAAIALKKAGGGGADIGNFLAGGGGGHKAREDHSAEKALRENFQFDQQMRRAQHDVLQAQQTLATDYVQRTTIGVQILDAEKAAYEAELQYEVALNKLTGGKEGMTELQAAQLRAMNDQKDSLDRTKLLQDEQEQRQKDVQMLTEHDFDRRREILTSQSQIAATASERRKIEIELLDLAYEAKRQALQNIIDTSKDEAAREDARRDLANLKSTYATDRKGVMDSTRGPLEDYLASLPDTAAKADEALQHLQVQGFQGLIDSALALTDGFGAAKKSLLSTLNAIVQGIIRMRLEAGVAAAAKGGGVSGFLNAFLGVANAVGGSRSISLAPIPMTTGTTPGGVAYHAFAHGGSFSIRGRGGTDRNVMSINGLPIARVSHGERVSIANDGVNGGAARVTIVPSPYFDAHVDGRAAQVAAPLAGRAALMGAAGAEERGYRRARRSIP